MSFESTESADEESGQKRDVFFRDVVAGLSRPQKHLPCQYFYDQRGCELFDQICELDEYYLTRTEVSIMDEHAAEIGACLGPHIALIEYGSGSSQKTRLLLRHLREPAAYVPVDIAHEHLQESVKNLADQFPGLPIYPAVEDFSHEFSLPEPVRKLSPKIVYFPGSTMGNFTQEESLKLLRQIADQCGSSGGLVIGLDLQKDAAVLEAAYNDRDGVTAQFNLNLLDRINRELAADFQLDCFRHHALYNESAGRIEMHLVSQMRQTVHIADREFTLQPDETICTEYSYKFDLPSFHELARQAGLQFQRVWMDPRHYFAVVHYSVA